MRKVLSLVAVAAFAFNASAMIYKCDKFNTSKKTCRLIGWSGSQPTSTKLKLPTTFTHTDGVTYTITAVEEHALDNLTEVTEITIPAGYLQLGMVKDTYTVSNATKNFNNCPRLRLFKVEDGSPILSATSDGVLYLKNLKTLLNVPSSYVTITGLFQVPEECKYISRDAFAGNTTIGSVALCKDVEVFDNGGFNRMDYLGKFQLLNASDNYLSLTNGMLTYKKRVVGVPPQSSSDYIRIPDGVTEISPYAFYNVAKLTDITLPSSVEKIGDNAFALSGIRSLTLPANVVNYGKRMVAQCQDIEKIKFESRLPMISDRFAENCPKLTTVESPNPIVKVGESAFKNCRELKNFPFRGETVLSEDSSFYNTGLEKVVFEESVITDQFAGEYLFAYCRNLTEIDFSRLIMEYVDADLAIGPGYAANCMKLKKVKFGDYAGFWHYNTSDRPTPPAFGYSCVIDTIYISTCSTTVSPQFVYSSFNGQQHFTPKVYATTTKNYGYATLYNNLPIGNMFAAGNGATVAPLIYLDAYILASPSWPDYISYVVPDATYFIPGGTSHNYSLATEKGNNVYEMFDISFTKTSQNTMRVKVTPRSGEGIEGFPKLTDFKAIFNGDYTVYAGADGVMDSPVGIGNITKVRLSYQVDGNYFLTDYTENHWTQTGIGLTEHETKIRMEGRNIYFTALANYQIFSTDGRVLMSGTGATVDLSSLTEGVVILKYMDSCNNSETLKIKL